MITQAKKAANGIEPRCCLVGDHGISPPSADRGRGDFPPAIPQKCLGGKGACPFRNAPGRRSDRSAARESMYRAVEEILPGEKEGTAWLLVQRQELAGPGRDRRAERRMILREKGGISAQQWTGSAQWSLAHGPDRRGTGGSGVSANPGRQAQGTAPTAGTQTRWRRAPARRASVRACAPKDEPSSGTRRVR